MTPLAIFQAATVVTLVLATVWGLVVFLRYCLTDTLPKDIAAGDHAQHIAQHERTCAALADIHRDLSGLRVASELRHIQLLEAINLLGVHKDKHLSGGEDHAADYNVGSIAAIRHDEICELIRTALRSIASLLAPKKT